MKALPSHRAIVEVRNIPASTKSLSFSDKISVVYHEGKVKFDAIVERGGHSAYRIFVEHRNLDASEMLGLIKAVRIITACGGNDMPRSLPLIDEIENYAGAEACTRVRIYSRNDSGTYGAEGGLLGRLLALQSEQRRYRQGPDTR